MLSIRFTRIGRKKAPLYRIVIMDKRKDPWGKYLEKLGFYNPVTKETQLEKERITYWLSQGAQCSASVHNLFVRNELIQGEKAKSVNITKRRAVKMNKASDDKKAADEKAVADKKAADESAAAKVLADKEAEKVAAQEATDVASAEAESTPVETLVDTETPVIEEVPKEEIPVVETPVEEASKEE